MKENESSDDQTVRIGGQFAWQWFWIVISEGIAMIEEGPVGLWVFREVGRGLATERGWWSEEAYEWCSHGDTKSYRLNNI